MSLQVWLPLNGNLDNQGASNVTITNNGATVNSNGKIGQCYHFGTAASEISIPKEAMTSFTTECSVTFWIKITTWNTNYATYFQAGLGNAPWAHYIFGFLRNNAASTVCFTISNGSSASNASYLTSELNLNTWYHVTLTYITGKCKIYLNGVLDHEYTTSIVPNFAGITKITLGRCNSSGYQSDCDMNDVRIYDHCLSPLEVKEIAQGLILHYKLDDTSMEGTTNLYSGTFSSTCYNGATSKYGYGTNTDMYKTDGVFQERQGTKIYMGTAGQSAYPYVYFDAFNTTGTQVHTLSFDYFPTIQNTIIPYSYNGTYNISYKTSNGAQGSQTNISSITIPVIVNQWNHISITMQKYDTTQTGRGNGYIRIGSSSHTSTTTDYWLFSNIQVEAKDHETAYTPPGIIRETGMIYDNSGYGHDGILNDSTAIISTNTKRYSTAFVTSQANNSEIYPIKGECNMPESTALTFAWWMNPTTIGYQTSGIFSTTNNTLPTDYTTTAVNMYDSVFQCCNTSGTSVRLNVASYLTINEWHHYALTYNGTQLNFYKDGVSKTTLTQTGALKAFKYIFPFYSKAGGSNRTTSGSLSDFRIYCTALSADDIKKLYKTGISMDNLEQIHSFEFIENSPTTKFTDHCQLKTLNLYENGYQQILHYDKTLYTEPDGSTWVRIFHHNNPASNLFTQNSNWSSGVYIDADRWYDIEEIVNNLVKYEFMVKQKAASDSTETKYRWIQNINPLTATYNDVKPASVTRITTTGYSDNTTYGGGLYILNSNTHMTIATTSNGSWWGASGCWTAFQGGIPGALGTVITSGYIDLYVRVYPNIKMIQNYGTSSIEFIER